MTDILWYVVTAAYVLIQGAIVYFAISYIPLNKRYHQMRRKAIFFEGYARVLEVTLDAHQALQQVDDTEPGTDNPTPIPV